MDGNSIRDEMKDQLGEHLKKHWVEMVAFNSDGYDAADVIHEIAYDLADIAFEIMGVEPDEQDKPFYC